MTTGPHLSQDEIILFALQLLPEEEGAAALEHLRSCEQCSDEVAHAQGDLVAYALTAEASAPPARSRERLLRRVAQEPRQVVSRTDAARAEPVLVQRLSEVQGQETDEPQRRRSVAPLLAWTGWALAAGLAVAGGLQYNARVRVQHELTAETARASESQQQRQRAERSLSTLTEGGAIQVALHPPSAKEPPRPEAHAAYLPGEGSLVLIATNLQPLQSYRTYELWLLPAQEGLSPIPAGLFKPDSDGNASLVTPDMPKGVQAKGFGITVEDEGGSKQPTLPIILAGS